MKATSETLDQMLEDFDTIFEEAVRGTAKQPKFWEFYAGNNYKLALSFWYKIVDDKADRNPQKKFRIFDHDPNHEMYPDGMNERTLRTALVKTINRLATIKRDTKVEPL